MLFSTPPNNESKREHLTPNQPCCPACGGPVIELREQSRCTRCHFTMCVGCESAPDGYCVVERD